LAPSRLPHRPALVLLVLALPAAAAFGRETPAESSPPAAPTFTRDVAPLLYRHCVACHRPGEVAPFSLLSYRDARKRAGLIGDVTADRSMPPWKPAPGHGDFRDARLLADAELATIRRWVDAGAVEGDPADLPPPPDFTPGWQLGRPDLVVTMPEPFTVPAEGRDVYRNFVIPVTIPAGRFLKAIEYRPSNRRVVHHAALGTDGSGSARALDDRDPGPGFTRVNLPAPLLPGSLATWTPGRDPLPLPEGFSMPWKPGAGLVLQLHLHPSGKPEVEQSSIGLYLTDEPPRRSMIDVMLINMRIDIPPGENEYKTRDEFTLPADVEALGIFPHMHLIGKAIAVTAVLPDGTARPLIRIDDWDFNWQNYYQYAVPVALPKDTRVVLECVHDNSADNPNNPNDPPRRVTGGEQTRNEMSAALLQFVPARDAELPTLVTALRRRIIGGITSSDMEGVLGRSTSRRTDSAPPALPTIRQLDRDGDGKLALDELVAATRGRLPEPALRQALDQFDRDGDDRLDAEEFAAAVRTFTRR
jgi:Ca2+-binding EF-hand superfamily protein/mono/diheme cytochrome c family protein